MKVRLIKRRTLPTYGRRGTTSWVLKHEFFKHRRPLSKRTLRFLRYRSYWK